MCNLSSSDEGAYSSFYRCDPGSPLLSDGTGLHAGGPYLSTHFFSPHSSLPKTYCLSIIAEHTENPRHPTTHQSPTRNFNSAPPADPSWWFPQSLPPTHCPCPIQPVSWPFDAPNCIEVLPTHSSEKNGSRCVLYASTGLYRWPSDDLIQAPGTLQNTRNLLPPYPSQTSHSPHGMGGRKKIRMTLRLGFSPTSPQSRTENPSNLPGDTTST